MSQESNIVGRIDLASTIYLIQVTALARSLMVVMKLSNGKAVFSDVV